MSQGSRGNPASQESRENLVSKGNLVSRGNLVSPVSRENPVRPDLKGNDPCNSKLMAKSFVDLRNKHQIYFRTASVYTLSALLVEVFHV